MLRLLQRLGSGGQLSGREEEVVGEIEVVCNDCEELMPGSVASIDKEELATVVSDVELVCKVDTDVAVVSELIAVVELVCWVDPVVEVVSEVIAMLDVVSVAADVEVILGNVLVGPQLLVDVM